MSWSGRSRLTRCPAEKAKTSSGTISFRQELQRTEDEYRENELLLQENVKCSRSPAVAALADSGAQFSGEIIEQMSPLLSFLLTWVLPIVIFIGIGQYMSKKLMQRAGGPNSMAFGMGKSNAKVYVKSSEGIKFSDVAGEANVPFFSMSGSEFVEMFVGMGAAKVRDLFKQAKEKAPCIVFIDEIDAIGKKREGQISGNDEREQTLNQLLTEMDGFEENSGVILLAATNRPESLDPALTRPGRFDRRVPVELPDLRGREEILKVHARKIRLAPDVDFSRIARMASGASGAELANIVNEAALRAVRDGRKSVTEADLEEIENKVATLTGGRAAEEVVFGSVTTGASNDIEQATKLSRAMITRYGMSDEFDMVAMETVTNQYLGGDASLACSAETQTQIDRQVVALVKKQHEKARKLLTDNRQKLDELAAYLYEKETITGEEFVSILNA